jgi:hypothetical protein
MKVLDKRNPPVFNNVCRIPAADSRRVIDTLLARRKLAIALRDEPAPLSAHPFGCSVFRTMTAGKLRALEDVRSQNSRILR